jgi:hypothetical protein
MSDKPVLFRDPGSPDEHDYVLGGDSAWISVKGFSVLLKKTDEGVVCDIYPLNDEDSPCIASTYAFDGEVE